MKIPRAVNAVTFLYFLAAGVTWLASDDASVRSVEGRLTLGDLAGLLVIGVFVSRLATSRHHRFHLPLEYRVYLPLLFVFVLGAAFAQYPIRALFELLILVFSLVVSVVLFNLHASTEPEATARNLLQMLLYAGGVLATVGLVDFFLWPSLLPGYENGLSGTFRNTGQAGAFFGMYLAVLIPGFLSGLIRAVPLNVGLLSSIVMALVFTSKRAAAIGLIVGLLILGLRMMSSTSKRDKKYGTVLVVGIVVLAPLAYLAFQWGLENISGMAWRFNKKFNQYTIDDFSYGFFIDNLNAMKTAFSMNPIIGVGLGNVGGIITDKYEIHSTYMSIVAYGGFLGAVAYSLFMGTFTWRLITALKRNVFGRYLGYFLPFLFGLLVSWGYTYHLRKREFWIIFFVVTLIARFARKTHVTSVARYESPMPVRPAPT